MPTNTNRRRAPPAAAAARNTGGARPKAPPRRAPTPPSAATTTPLGAKLQQAKAKQQNNQRQRQASRTPSQPSAPRRRKKKKASSGKRYRKVKVLRWWVLPAIFFVPMGILLVEYYIGKLISLDDVKDTYYKQFGIDPWDIEISQKVGPVPSIANLTGFARTKGGMCNVDLKGMINLHNPKTHATGNRKIPMILHQHGQNRCMTSKYYSASVQWASTMKRWSYYFHDDQAVERLLFDNEFPEFPLWKAVASHCLDSIATTRLGVQLWKFLVLWLFGGVYVDINYQPESFGLSTIDVNDDALLVVDSTDKNSFNTKIMAASPRHPLFFYAIRRMLDDLVDEKSNVSGDLALQEAFEEFQNSNKDSSNVPPLLETGTFPWNSGSIDSCCQRRRKERVGEASCRDRC